MICVTEESPYLMVLKGSQVIDMSTDGSGRAGQLAPIVGIQGKKYKRKFLLRGSIEFESHQG